MRKTADETAENIPSLFFVPGANKCFKNALPIGHSIIKEQ